MSAFPPGLEIITECTGRGRREARRSAVTDKVALVEQFDQRVLAMANNGAGVAHGSGPVIITGVGGGWIASQTGKEILSQWTEVMSAGVEGLCIGHGQSADERRIQA